MTTNEPLDLHRPTAAFRDYLEGEVIREFRRRRTFRRLRAAAVIVVSIGVGMSATLASAQVRESSAKDSLLTATQADVMLLQLRLELVRAQVADEQQQIKAGLRPAGDVPSLEQLREMEAAMARLHLNIEEIRATSRPPRDELNAPLVNGRDFVRQRLEVDAMIGGVRLNAEERKLEVVARRVRVGAATPLELADYEANVARRRGEVAVVAERLKARREFLEQGTSVQELTVRIERVEVQQAVIAAQAALRNAQARLALVQQQRKVGMATDLEALRAEVDLKMQELELQKLVRRLEQLRKSREGEGDQLAGGTTAR